MNTATITRALALWGVLCVLLAGCGGKPRPDPVFDIPALIGKDIAEVEATLGPADETLPPQAGTDPVNNKFWRRGVELQIDYVPATGQVVAFYLTNPYSSADSPEDAKANCLALGNLQNQGSNYHTEFLVFSNEPGQDTAVRVIPE